MLHRSTRVIVAVSIIVFLVSACVLGGFGWVVVQKKIAYLDLHQKRAEYKEYQDALQIFNDTSERVKDSRIFLESRIIDDAEIITLLALIESIGRDQGVILTTSSLTTNAVNDTFETLSVRMEISGTHDRVLSTLALLEQLPYQVAVPNIEIMNTDEGTWKSSAELSVTKFKKL